MPDTNASNRSRLRTLTDVLAVLFCAALAALYLTPSVLDPDEAINAAVAMRMNAFDLPTYAAGWVPKPPAGYHVYRWVFAVAGAGNMLAMHVVMALCWVGTGVLCGLAARRLMGPLAFAPTVAAYGLLRSFGYKWPSMAGAANSEALLSPLVVIALFCFLTAPRRPRISGLIGGACLALAALFKPPVALYGVAVVAAVLVLRGPRKAGEAAWTGLVGALAVFAATWLHLIATGDLEAALICNVEWNSVYIEHGPVTSLGDRVARLFGLMGFEKAPWAFVTVGLGAAAVRPGVFGEADSVRRWAGAGVILLLAGLYMVTLGGYFFHHYWVMVHPVIAVGVGAGWTALAHSRIGTPTWKWVGRAVAVLIVLTLWVPAQRLDKRRMLRERSEDRFGPGTLGPVADKINEHAAADDSIWIWGWQPALYVVAGRTPASRFVICSPLSGSVRSDVLSGVVPPEPDTFPTAWPLLFEDLERHRPKVIVGENQLAWTRFPVTSFPRLSAYLEEHYERGETVGPYDLYVRKAP